MGANQSCPQRNEKIKEILKKCYTKDRTRHCQTFAFCNKKAREELAKMPKENGLFVYSPDSTNPILYIFFFAFLSFCIYLSFSFNKKNKPKSGKLSVDVVSQINPQVDKNENKNKESDLLIV